mgnify:CR=1 FL=1
MNICVYGAASNIIHDKYISVGEELGKKIAKRGHSLVFGAGSSGMMGAAARGVYSCGGKITGILPDFLNVDGVQFKHCDKVIRTESMRERKRLLFEKSDGFIITPGGIGTLDEFFEILTLRQLGRHNKPIAFLNVAGYYDDLLKMLWHMVDENFMFDESMKLFEIFNTSDAALDYLESYHGETIDVKHMKSLNFDEH